jgi:PEGA domain
MRALMLSASLVLVAQAAAAQAPTSPDEGEPTEPTETSETPAVETPPPVAQRDADKVRARELFFQGFELQEAEDFAGALAAFQRSRALYATRNATNNAAVCLLRLKRVPEALVMFETLLREFPKLPAAERQPVLREVQRLRAMVGAIVINGAPLGAQIVVAGRTVGQAPLLDPIRVRGGSIDVGVYKEGFVPLSVRLEVAGGETVSVEAKLEALMESGVLKVAEHGGSKLDVVLDGVVVGTTPWRGRVGLGRHVVWLRGDDDVGTEPAAIEVSPKKVATLTLDALALEGELLVEAKPPGARVLLDQVNLGAGVWEGRVTRGKHLVEVQLDGFLPQRHELEVGESPETLSITLERDPDADAWKEPNRVALDATFAVGLSPTFGGDVTSGCTGECRASLPLGFVGQAFAGYELSSGWGFGAFGGYLFVQQGIEDRTVELQPRGLPPRTGQADETLQLSAGMFGFAAGYRFGDFPTVQFRLGLGILLGTVGNLRQASFEEGTAFVAPDLVSRSFSAMGLVNPTVVVALPVGGGFELGADVSPMVIIPFGAPRWGDDGDRSVIHPDAGVSGYRDETLVGSVMLLIAPGLFARYQF